MKISKQNLMKMQTPTLPKFEISILEQFRKVVSDHRPIYATAQRQRSLCEFVSSQIVNINDIDGGNTHSSDGDQVFYQEVQTVKCEIAPPPTSHPFTVGVGWTHVDTIQWGQQMISKTALSVPYGLQRSRGFASGAPGSVIVDGCFHPPSAVVHLIFDATSETPSKMPCKRLASDRCSCTIATIPSRIFYEPWVEPFVSSLAWHVEYHQVQELFPLPFSYTYIQHPVVERYFPKTLLSTGGTLEIYGRGFDPGIPLFCVWTFLNTASSYSHVQSFKAVIRSSNEVHCQWPAQLDSTHTSLRFENISVIRCYFILRHTINFNLLLISLIL